MTRNYQPILIVAGLVAVLSGLAACHGPTQSGSGYVPTPALQQQNAAVPLPRDVIGANVGNDKSPISSTCGTEVDVSPHRHAVCRFIERGTSETFTITSHLAPHAVINPDEGTKQTRFTIRGLSPGTGDFVVQDSHKNSLTVSVVVGDGNVLSSCGDNIQIKIAGIVNCQFSETGFHGTYVIDSHLNGIASVSPNKGTHKTQFTVLGLVVGGGYFVVHGAPGLSLKVHVSVTL
jgi:hypothetical protein